VQDIGLEDTINSEVAATLRAAQIQADATKEAAVIQAKASIEAAQLQAQVANTGVVWQTAIGSIALAIAIITTVYSAKKNLEAAKINAEAAKDAAQRQSRLEDDKYEARIKAYRFAQEKITIEVQKAAHNERTRVLNHSKTEGFSGFDFQYTLLPNVPDDWSAKNWETHLLLDEEFLTSLYDTRRHLTTSLDLFNNLRESVDMMFSTASEETIIDSQRSSDERRARRALSEYRNALDKLCMQLDWQAIELSNPVDWDT
jgi:hypothetical protein